MIPVCVSPNVLDYIHKTNNKHMQIKEVCKNHPSDHYMFTPGTIKQLGININGSTIEAYTQAKPQKIHSFVKCILPKYCKHAPLI